MPSHLEELTANGRERTQICACQPPFPLLPPVQNTKAQSIEQKETEKTEVARYICANLCSSVAKNGQVEFGH